MGDGDSVHFSPCACHLAGLMVKGMYCLKKLLFREQFKMNTKELQAVRRISCLPLSCMFTAPVTCEASYNDLCMPQSMEAFHGIASQVAEN